MAIASSDHLEHVVVDVFDLGRSILQRLDEGRLVPNVAAREQISMDVDRLRQTIEPQLSTPALHCPHGHCMQLALVVRSLLGVPLAHLFLE